MSNEAAEVRSQLIELMPAFEERWASSENLFISDDGAYTTHGVFAELTHFFRDYGEAYGDEALRGFGAFIERCVSGDNSEISNAVVTCFLENLAGESSSERLAPFLGPASLSHLGLSQGAT